PAFEGTTTPGESGQVTVHVYEGSGTGGKEVVALNATPSGAKWSVAATSALADGQYTAQATQPSSIGNEAGKTAAVEFEVFSGPPEVKITHAPEKRSKQNKPTFEGEASETAAVTVHIYEGSGTGGKEATSLVASVAEHKWHVTATNALADGKYTAVASEPSSLGNEEGKSEAVEFEIFTTTPAVVFTKVPAARSNQTKPAFEGTTTPGETGQVTVHIYEGSGTGGKEAVGLKVTPAAGKWSVAATSALANGTYTAVATEPSAIGNGEGTSGAVEFEVFTKPPAVVFTKVPAARSNQTKPAFEGSTTPGETGQVTVHVYEGSGTGGKEVVALTATPSGAKWSVAAAGALGDGKYTAQATQPSSLGNEAGKSAAVEFEVFSGPPEVKITHGPEKRSNQSKPSFEGEASETAAVTVHIYEGSGTGGKEAVSLPASVSEHKWHVTATNALADGKYTAVATEPSSLGNEEGNSEPVEFEVFTKPPAVVFTKVPASRSNQTKPAFEGSTTLGETGQVTVHVYEGSGTGGKEVVGLKATPSGAKWSVAATSALASGKYTAQATQPSSLGNEAGKTAAVEFEVFTDAPEVKITHAPEARSKQSKPTFEGEASETEPVTVRVYEGSGTGGKEVASLSASVAEHKWHVTASSALADGKYTAVASEPSSIGNEEGKSEPVEFEIFTKPPALVFTKVPPSRSKQTKPTFEGTTTPAETGQVTVHIYLGSGTGGEEVLALKATPSSGKWSAAASSVALSQGKYTARATQPSSIGNEAGKTEAAEFEVFTEPPSVELQALPARSKVNKPTFRGSASESGMVTVHVHEGAGTAGKVVGTFEVAAVAGKEWSVVASPALADGFYTAQATEPSALGNEEGKSEPVEFEVFTKPPAVVFAKVPAARSNQTKPAFEGTTTAGEVGQVTVHIYEGSGTGGKEAVALTATPAGAKWSVAATGALAQGKYTAQATQPSSLGNEAGKTEAVEFEIFTGPPEVKVTHAPEKRSKQNKPTFEGEASETAPVTVHVFEGSGTTGKEVVSLPASVAEHKWHVTASNALADGKYTAVASEPSSIGNATGESEPVEFEVFTKPPALLYTKVPAARSKQSQPAFEGTTTPGETGQVTVHIYEGSGTGGKEAVGLKATPSAGKWAVTASSGLPDGEYTAQATQPSSIGNEAGKTEAVEFEILTAAPKVELQALPARSKVNKPTFRGSASESGTVTVHVHEGAGPSGKVVTSFEVAAVAGKEWSVVASPALADGLYTAVATEPSALGNEEGKSEPVEFEVFTKPPALVFTKVPAVRSNQNKPVFEGTTTPGETAQVTVHVYEGSGPGGKEVAALKATLSGSKWSVAATTAVPDGQYTAQATQPSSLGNEAGKTDPVEFEVFTGAPAVTFTHVPEERSNVNKPAFEGTTTPDETGQVTVHVYEGSGTGGKEVASLRASPSSAKWSVTATSALADGDYTAQATQPSSLGNAAGASKAVEFEVFTGPPAVKITHGPGKRSNVTKPVFEGSTTPGETGQVTVHIYEGHGTGGKEATSLKVSPSSAKWTASVTTALSDGAYTAQATEPSSLGNGAGASEAIEFEIFTGPSTVKITHGPEPRSKQNKPSFEGEATETEPVTLHIYEGPGTGGKQLPSLKATVTESKWHVTETSALPDGKYTAQATEPSSIGNAEGESAIVEFEVFTGAPAVKITHPPEKRSKQNKPAFEGTTTNGETAPVTVHIYEGHGTGGKEATSLKATPSSGKWSTAATTALPDGAYTAQATEPSSLGNATGTSEAVEFEVFTGPPTVKITQGPAERSKQTKPSFEGEASETEPVTVTIFEGGTTKEVLSLKANVAEHKWHIASIAALPDGKYTAKATEPSSLGNAAGESEAVEFEIFTKPPAVTFTKPPALRSKQNKPTFEGSTTAGETGQITVHIFEAGGAGKEVTSLKATPSSAKWSVTPTTSLSDGSYAAYATQPSSLGNEEGRSGTVAFTIFTRPPAVQITHGPQSRSNVSKPTFEGTTTPGETTPITVHIYEAPGTTKEVTSLNATPSAEGTWSVTAAAQLADDEYIARATEPSAIGNEEGGSETVAFEIFTKPPALKLEHGPEKRSKVNKPVFEGITTPKETSQVTVRIFEGAGTGGKEVESLKATPSAGKWSVSPSTALPDKLYTEQISEPSAIGNAEAKLNPVEFEIYTHAPAVAITVGPKQPRANQTKPPFEGKTTLGESEPVTVHIYEGAGTAGKEVQTLKATPASGNWSVTPTTELVEGVYTAQATQPSSIGNPEGKSELWKFEVATAPPTVKLTKVPPLRSNQSKPAFEGEASETEPVTVRIFEGASTSGKVAATLTAPVSERKWHVTASAALADGEYTALATEPSSIGNGPGEVVSGIFRIYTKPPALTCNELPAKSGQTTPTFAGSSNESGLVTIRVYKEVKKPENEEFTLEAHVSESGKWTAGPVTPGLAEGSYIVVASQSSDIGNPAGSCEVPFEILTGAPIITLESPQTPSRNTSPSFSGHSSEKGPLTVEVFEGPTREGNIVSTVETTVTGTCSTKSPCKWSTGAIPSLFSGSARHLYTAVAVQTSSITKRQGESEPQRFEVDTAPPTVTLAEVPAESNVNRPAFSGTASDPKEEVTVRVYKGPKPEGEVAATVKAKVINEQWTTAALAAVLPDGQYTALATQPSSLGNPAGESRPDTFVVNTKSPVVTLRGVPSPTSDAAPSFSGEASDPREKVTVHVYRGSSPSGQPVASVEAEPLNGQWSSPSLAVVGASLEDGEYTAVAEQPSSLNNAPGHSAPVRFVVEVQPPTVTEPSASASRTAAIMNATVDANGGRLSVCRFEYGTTAEYGKEAQCAFVAVEPCAFVYPAASSACEFPLDRPVNMFARTNHVTPGTTYLFRIVVENDHGNGRQAVGEGQFRTADPEPVEETPQTSTTTTGKGGGNTPSDAVLGATIAKALAPTGKGAKIGKLLKTGGYKAVFKIGSAGTAVVGWYYLPKGASLSKQSSKKPKPVLVAAGKVTLSGPSGATLKVGLTPAGRRLLKSAGKLKLTARCSFLPAGKTTPIVTLKTFTLKR
ncbi:MAG TPA: Ig-like domain-containing protein, partial [Solirubrobacteraceae bacterium]|nr:Ig-like domain-containing protein [Solirubrobacteraceae bacterium]